MASKKLKIIPASQGALFTSSVLRGPQGLEALVKLRSEVRTCTLCPLHEHRRCVVFGAGKPDVLLALIGEAPSAQDDDVGYPFVGRAGHQLTRMLAAMGLQRDEVYLTHSVMCRPELNRPPTNAELDVCRTHLYAQLNAVRPKVIVCLGMTAARALLRETKAMEYMRQTWHQWEGIPVRVTYHPALLLKPEGEGVKGHAWLDLQEVLTKLGLPIPTEAEAHERSSRVPDLGWELR